MSGAGTSSTTTNQGTTTAPWAPTQQSLLGDLTTADNLPSQLNSPTSQDAMFADAGNLAQELPNPGTAAANLGSNFMGGDPQGTLASGLNNYTSTVSPIANMNTNPTTNPETQQLLQAIQDQTTQSINSQFAGAGRSGSGYNTKDLAMGLSEGEAPTLFNQYNQNVANVLGASSGLLNADQSTQSLENANQQTGLNMTAAAQPLSQLPSQTAQTAYNAPATSAAQVAGLGENLTIPIAGLGGATTGAGSGTATNSTLSQLQQLGSLLGSLI